MENSKFAKINAFVFDVDGVMTDGGIFADNEGNLFRTFDAKDAFAMRMASMNGYALGVITGGRSRSIAKRMLVCGVPEEDVYLGSRNKMEEFRDFCLRHGLAPEEIMYFGDDLPDVPGIRACRCGRWPA
ncbi:MAG: KdsC family phosphatase, partial [Candidatus Cryptobacteroides sp.]